MLRFIEDPSHGWLEVPETALAKVGLSVADFSLYSYRHNGKLYLEEDCDAPKFFEAWEPISASLSISEFTRLGLGFGNTTRYEVELPKGNPSSP